MNVMSADIPGRQRLWRSIQVAIVWSAIYGFVILLIAAWGISPVWLQLPLAWFVLPLLVYLATPIGILFRAWRYLSGFLITHRATPWSPLALHLGTTYDVIWGLMAVRRPGETLFQTMYRELYTGLHRFSERVQRGEIAPETRVVACSYFLSSKQMARYGFRDAPTSWSQRLSFVAGYPEVLAQQWLITGRLRFFNPLAVRAFTATAGEIAARADYFARLARRSSAPQGPDGEDPSA